MRSAVREAYANIWLIRKVHSSPLPVEIFHIGAFKLITMFITNDGICINDDEFCIQTRARGELRRRVERSILGAGCDHDPGPPGNYRGVAGRWCAVKSRNCALKTRNCVFKMMDFAGRMGFHAKSAAMLGAFSREES